MGKLTVVDHPLIKDKVSILRQKDTGTNEFRRLANEIAMLEAYEATRDLELEEYPIETPLEETTDYSLSGKKLAVVPILRAGLGMVDAFLEIVPTARVGHIGLYRDPETFKAIEYYIKLPQDVSEREIFVLDPMIATGNTLEAAIGMLKEHGCKSIRVIALIGAPEGIKLLQENHPDVDIYIAALDPSLDDHMYIRPGLGDAGDRLFGTK